MEPDAVLAKMKTKPGDLLSELGIRSDIQALFAMGYFEEIEVKGDPQEGNRVLLTVEVKERPVISKIDFEGNEQLTDADLLEVIKLREWAILDLNKVKEDVGRLQKHYEEKGFYLAKVSFELKKDPKKPDEEELVFKINDYEKVQIKKIQFLNNRKFSDSKLKDIFQETKEGGFFSFVTGSGSFKETAFKQDLQRLTLWYLENGYIKFKYDNPVVTVSNDKRWLYISIYVDEGEPYSMGTLDFGGELLFTKEELKQDLQLIEGERFSISKRNADIQRLTEKYQDLGYAFANVIPKMAFHDDAKTFDMQYDFEKGGLVHFGEINILGNSKTYDKVIRRELKITEGALFSGSKLRESRENVERLGFFAPGEVVFNTVTPKGQQDVLNVEITIKERSTGTITLGAGYGSANGLFFTTQLSEINLFGRGQAVNLTLQFTTASTDALSRKLVLGFTEPYTFDTKWSSGFDLFLDANRIPGLYVTTKMGTNLRIGHPIWDYTNLYFTYRLEDLAISEPVNGVPQALIDLDKGSLSSVIANVVRDKRNNRFETTDGNYQSLSLEFAGLGFQKNYVKTMANNRYYKKLFGDLVFRHSAEVGQIWQTTSTALPRSEKFTLGGPFDLRGYPAFTVSPKMISGGSEFAVGGSFKMTALFELEYPLIKDAGIKLVTFFDMGNSWEGIPNSPPKLDVGFGIRWFSPIGPLRFEFGYPLFPGRANTSSGLEEPQFVFFIGPPF